MFGKRVMKRVRSIALAVLVFALVTAACAPQPTATLSPMATPLPAKTPTATPTQPPTPRPTDTPMPTSTPVPSLSGRVTDAATGQGIAGATVEARLAEQPGGWDHSTTTVSGGTYAMFGLPTGDYVVRVIAPGYAREYYDNVIPSREATIVHVTALSEIPGVDFDLTEGGSISGYVVDKAGNPIEGAGIEAILSGEQSSEGFFTATASDGRYVVENLALGEYKVGAMAEGWLGQWYGNNYNPMPAPDIPVVPPNTTTGIDFHLGRGGSVSGLVYESDGVTPVEGVTIWIHSETPNGEPIDFGSTSGPDGSFLATDIFPWNYKVQASKPGFATEWYDAKNNYVDADVVVVEEGGTVSDILFTLDPGGLVTGRVYGEDGKPISGVRVHAHLTTGEWVTLSDLTDPDGGYSLWLSTDP